MLACRLCKVAIAAPTGCAVCDPVRQNLVVVGEDDDDRPSVAGTASEALSLLKAQLKFIKAEWEKNKSSEIQLKKSLAISNSISKLAETARKLIQDGVSAVETMSFREQAELFVGWYMNLAPAYRADVLAKFTAFEQEIAQPVVDATEN